ncbi:glycosyl hydrolase family 16 [Micromonospora pisi]|uniref:Glycosyl hydrolase family 16 n=1 Tax=Micromonospora pisi TaxID=589240 RepID=A0A495JUV0_9ACTN|nr:carbohydrate-binding protein [Micromonospora pisi]RKR92082.1 glycosyl hydrolase family 16 [Micromonospora pisi]
MSTKPTARSLAAGAAAVLAAGTLAGLTATASAGTAPSDAPAIAANCGVLFDDFAYSSSSDPAIAARNWTVRTNSGGPGVPGAAWPAANVSFPTDAGQKVLQLTAKTDGTAGGTSHSEFFHQRKFFEGTYASRVRFADTPSSGPDGDHLVETFFTITPLDRPLDPNYGEIDFEYLPNGGWGEQGPIFYQTTWETYQNEPWQADNTHTAQRTSFNGWHDLVFTVSDGRVKYYVDGVQVADHGDRYYPETPMSINFNLWFIDLTGRTGTGLATYVQQVDYLYYADREVITTAEAKSRVTAYRSAGTNHVDTVGTGGTCPTTPPTSTPTTRPPTTPPTTRPPTTPPTTAPPANCAAAPAWDWGTVYLEGARVKHNGRLWQANWWTQGSEPGLTAQWRDLGRC